MRSQEQLNSIITNLKTHIDCLLIRMQSCQQSIERLFKIVSEVSSNCHEKFSSLDQINYSTPNSPDRIEKDKVLQKGARKVKRSMPDAFQLQNFGQSFGGKKAESTKQPSLRDFLLLSSHKQMSKKNAEPGSFTIFKEAILGNMNQIQSLSSNFDILRRHVEQKLSKSNSAIQLLTKVTTMMEQKMEKIIITKKSKQKQKQRRSKSKSIGKYHYGYQKFQMGKTPRDHDFMANYISM